MILSFVNICKVPWEVLKTEGKLPLGPCKCKWMENRVWSLYWDYTPYMLMACVVLGPNVIYDGTFEIWGS